MAVPLLMAATLRWARRLIVAVVGGTVVLIGVIMIVTPGPAVVVIPIGLGILALEFAWARRLLQRVRARLEQAIRQDQSGGDAK